MMRFEVAGRTEIGEVRANNEDAVLSSERLVSVADGMGGAPGGELASALAVTVVDAAFRGRSIHELEAAVWAANRAIWQRAGSSGELEGMGTTICAAGLTDDATVAIVNVGDSRAYLLHDGTLTQLTHDHSVTGDLIRRGELTEEEALRHPHRGILTRALGVGPDVDLDSAGHPAVEGDRILVCSDGLINEVPTDEIEAVVASTADLGATVAGIVELALSAGAHDNVSAVVAQICT